MRHLKPQLEVYELDVTPLNLPATIKDQNAPRPRKEKNPTADQKMRYKEALTKQFKTRIANAIKGCKDNNFDKFYGKLCSSSRLPRGIVVDAARSISVDAKFITQFLKNQVLSSSNNSVYHWKKYVEDNFEAIKQHVLYEEEAESDTDNERYPEDDYDSYQDVTEYRACTTTFQSIIRSDLAAQAHLLIEQTITQCIQDVSNYASDLSIQVLKVALVFSEHKFVLENDTVSLVRAQGPNISHVLPNGYLQHDIFVASPLNPACLQDQDFKSAFDLLFQDSHLGVIHSSLYGQKGVTEASLKKHSIHQKIFAMLDLSPLDTYHHLPSHVTKTARDQYSVNVNNMWSDNSIVNKLLKRLLHCLLCVHLRPEEVEKRRTRLAELKAGRDEPSEKTPKTGVPVNDICFARKTRNGRRKIIADETKRQQECLLKGKHEAASRCYDRLDTYRQVMERERADKKSSKQIQQDTIDDEEEALVKDEIQTERTRDISKRRIGKLLQQVRSNLFQSSPLSKFHVVEKIPDLQDYEFDTMSKIALFVKPFMAPRANYGSLPYQLPFLLMANQVLRCTGHANQCAKFLPVIKPTALHSLVIDTSTLYGLFCSESSPQPMAVCNFQRQVIKTHQADAYKDAVFSSFFNIDYLKRLSISHGHQFANRLHILPGLRTVRVYGAVDRIQHSQSQAQEPTQDPIDDDNAALKQSRALLSTWQENLKTATKKLQDFLLQPDSVRKLKKNYKKDDNGSWKKVEDAKLKKRKLMVAISVAKSNIQASKQAIRECKTSNTLPSTQPVATSKYLVHQSPCLKKAEECMFDPDMDLHSAVFASTDNGIIKMTETVFFGIERFKYHLELHNRFETFDDPMDVDIADDAQELECMQLPVTLTISSKQLSQGTGLNTYQKSLKRKKKRPGQQVTRVESTLSSNSLHSCNTPDELEASANIHRGCRDAVRSCYHSSSQRRKKSQFELRKNRYLDRIASYERKSSGVRHPIMFVGDRGHGYGSSIKGHLRFGGHWKEERHGRYTPTVITNEYNSSQTCLFCFGKLSHPTYAKDNAVKITRGTFVCMNSKCPNAFRSLCRDQVSALAIGLAGVAQLLFGTTFPCFDQQTNYQRRSLFYNQALSFLDRKQGLSSLSMGAIH